MNHKVVWSSEDVFDDNAESSARVQLGYRGFISSVSVEPEAQPILSGCGGCFNLSCSPITQFAFQLPLWLNYPG